MRLGFILIGFFIRNLVKKNVKNGPNTHTYKKMCAREEKKNASSIIHQRDAVYIHTCIRAIAVQKLPNRNQQKFALQFFLFRARINVCVCRSFIYSILFSKRMPMQQRA